LGAGDLVNLLQRSKQAIGLAGFSVSATFAPAIGPTIGGYLTDYYGWPWVFYVNLAPELVMLAALWFTLPKSTPRLGLLRQGDWLGIALMAVGLTAFQIVLDDGNVYNWFDSPFIVKLSLVAVLALGAFVLWQFIATSPLMHFRLLGRRNFGLGTLGISCSASRSTVRLFCWRNTSPSRRASMPSKSARSWHGPGCRSCLVIPLVPLLMKRIDARLLVGIGLVVFAASCFMNLWLDQDYAASQFFWPDVIRAVGQAIVMTPISAIALVGITQSEAGAASGLFKDEKLPGNDTIKLAAGWTVLLSVIAHGVTANPLVKRMAQHSGELHA
jgi:DHA2 family multidrug resistance protein